MTAESLFSKPYFGYCVRQFKLAIAAVAVAWMASNAQAQLLPFKAYVGKVETFDIQRGVNNITINDGFVVAGTIPVSPNNVYKLKPGQSLALMYQARNKDVEHTGANWGDHPVNGFEKVIRLADGKAIDVANYTGVGVFWETTVVRPAHDTEYTIFRKYKSKFKPALPADEFKRTHGIFLVTGQDPVAASKSSAFAKDLNKMVGKTFVAHYLVSRIDSNPFLTIEVDYSEVQTASEQSPTPKSSANARSPGAEQASNARGASQEAAAQDRTDQKQAADEAKAAAKESRADARVQAAAERAQKRAEAAAQKLGR